MRLSAEERSDIIDEKAGGAQLNHDGARRENAAGNRSRPGIPGAGEHFGTWQKAGTGGSLGVTVPTMSVASVISAS